MTYELYLEHHGVKGMHWGVRRYQNYDGSLTSLGKRRALKKEFRRISTMDRDEIKNEKAEVKAAGVKKGLFRDSLAKGSTIYRYTSKSNEPIDERRKYVSITPTDRDVYKKDALANALSNKGESIYLNEYVSQNKLKIAKAENVTKDIIKKYGDKHINDVYKETRLANARTGYHKLNKELRDPSNPNHWMYEHVTKNQEELNRFLHKNLYDKKTSQEILNKYKRKGYDAIVDPEDYSDAYYYPLIILNPSKSLKMKRTNKVR